MESYISRSRFKLIGDNLLKYIVTSEFHDQIDFENLLRRIYRDKDQLEYEEILKRYSENESKAAINFIKLVILADYSLKIFKARQKINIQFVWRLIFDSLSFFKKDNPVAGIGSQGFLSIELYRVERKKNRTILRLHIWNESFANHFGGTDFGKYKVHSHLYNAQSYVLAGNIVNERYDVQTIPDTSQNSLYNIDWKSIVDENGSIKRKSELSVCTSDVKITKLSTETIAVGQEYSVSTEEFHSTQSISSLSATLFLFDSSEGLSDKSKVVGPKNDASPGFKYEPINFLSSLYEIDREIRKYYNRQTLLALDWMRKIHILEHAHRIESRHLSTFSEILSWSMVGIPAIISALSFYLNKFPAQSQSIVIWVAILAGISAILGTINKVIKPSDLSEKHRDNSEKFEHLRHELEKNIVFNNDERMEHILTEIHNDWKNLTLHNVKEKNFKAAVDKVGKLKIYPATSSFLKG